MLCSCGGSLDRIGPYVLKCGVCGHHKVECEIYSRVVGYIRPVEQWNDGKQSEFGDRVMFSVGSPSGPFISRSLASSLAIEGQTLLVL